MNSTLHILQNGKIKVSCKQVKIFLTSQSRVKRYTLKDYKFSISPKYLSDFFLQKLVLDFEYSAHQYAVKCAQQYDSLVTSFFSEEFPSSGLFDFA